MKFAVTREDLRRMIQKEAGIDINVLTVDLEIEGYVKAKDYRLKAQLGGVGSKEPAPELPKITTITDGNMNVIDIVDETGKSIKSSMPTLKEEPRKKRKYKKRKRTGPKNQYGGPVDYKDYEQIVLDFATSSDDKRLVPSFGLSLTCVKERYKLMIKKLGVNDSVRFGQVDYQPTLFRITEEKVEEAPAVSE